ncbi:MAG TPA: DUF5668 domain-containing protein, partial [Polyangiaceae bacterium]|nr:DUF5668 domain-containing protein [Polyangiaceae bacterium]
MRANKNRPGIWPGLLLVSVGIGLLAREFGWLPAQVRVWDFWPLFVVLIGISALLRAKGAVSAFLALAFIGIGGVLLAANLGFLAVSVTRLWPLLLVLLGVVALFRGGRETEPEPTVAAERAWPEDALPDERELSYLTDPDRLVRQYSFSGAELRIESQAWRGGELGVTAGGVELDLRQARLDPEGAVLMLHVLMGGVEIRVPDTWQV